MIKKCLFPAAGYGTRFLPATKAMPKEMLPVVNKPLIQYGVELLHRYQGQAVSRHMLSGWNETLHKVSAQTADPG